MLTEGADFICQVTRTAHSARSKNLDALTQLDAIVVDDIPLWSFSPRTSDVVIRERLVLLSGEKCIGSDDAFRVADSPGVGPSMTTSAFVGVSAGRLIASEFARHPGAIGDMSQWRSGPRQTLSQERSISESPLASFRCAYWAVVPCKNQTALSLRKEPLWRNKYWSVCPRLRRYWQNSNTASNPHDYREFQKFNTTQKEDTMTQAIATQ